MRTIFTFLTAVLLTVQVFAQAPQKMSYQAVLRDNNSQHVMNAQVKMQISILHGSITGTPVYVETQTPTTNLNGLVSLEIGSGTPLTGTFEAITWENGPFFIKTETDLTGGTNYTITGTSQLLSVPYALHAKTAESVISPTYTVGPNSDLGGYICYVTPDGKHGLVITSQDLSIGIQPWFYARDMVSNPNLHNADGKKFTDWRLPTYNELLYLIKPVYQNIGFLANTHYWSSYDDSTTGYGGNAYTFYNGNISSINKGANGKFRAVRSF